MPPGFFGDMRFGDSEKRENKGKKTDFEEGVHIDDTYREFFLE